MGTPRRTRNRGHAAVRAGNPFGRESTASSRTRRSPANWQLNSARRRGLEKMADTYLDEARDCYARWGAVAKVSQLKQATRARQQAPLAARPTTSRRLSSSSISPQVIEVSEAVAGEIVLEKLIETLMVIAVEHAGADRGLLILPHGGQYRIEAGARSGRDGVRVRLLGNADDAFGTARARSLSKSSAPRAR